MVMTREFSAILRFQIRAGLRTDCDLSVGGSTNETSVVVQHYVRKIVRVTPCANAETPACSALISRFQVSANPVPAAIEIPMIPDDLLTSERRVPF